MKVDLKELSNRIKEEILELEKRKVALMEQMKQIIAVQKIAAELGNDDPVDKALQQLTDSAGDLPEAKEQEDSTPPEESKKDEGEDFDWAFQATG